MKSLGIVNRNIKATKKLLYNLKDIQEGTKEDFEKYYHEQELKDFKIIKQDLEVLEILKKYIYYKEHEIKLKSIRKSIYDFDYEKIKQWLEENENE